MADIPADRLVVHFHDDTDIVYEGVTYTLWGEDGEPGVTVFRDGAQIARWAGVQGTTSEHVPAAA